MKNDALQPIAPYASEADDYIEIPSESSSNTKPAGSVAPSVEVVESAKDYVKLNARDRLCRVVAYLRQKYFYCFWCGTQYSDEQDLTANCPGEDEDAHD